ncbi:MAG TPA: O-antigen ligase family protein [Candidatus Thermoplasmatota archaeon]|nr:O-antigen ligase family protein [Candidatus Thermoplasmatota archaeon]
MIEVGGINFHLLEPFILAWCIFQLVRFVKDANPVTQVAKTHVVLALAAMVLLLLAIGLSAANAVDPEKVWYKGALKWGEIFGIAFAAYTYADSKPKQERLLLLLKIVTGLAILGGFALGVYNLVASGKAASVGNVDLCLLILRRIPGDQSLLLFALSAPAWHRGKAHAFITVASACLVVASLSRGAFLGLVVVLGALALYSRKADVAARQKAPAHRRRWVTAVLSATVFLVVFALVFREELGRRFSEIGDFSLRLRLLELAVNAFLTSPIIGIGAENYGAYLISTNQFPAGHGLTENLAPHNHWIQFLAETGIVGFAALVLLYVCLIRILVLGTRSKELATLVRPLSLFLLTHMAIVTFGYVAGSDRLELGLFLGTVLSIGGYIGGKAAVEDSPEA